MTEARVRFLVAQAQSPKARWSTSFDPDTRTYVCRACQRLPRIVTMARQIIEDGAPPESALDAISRAGYYERKSRILAQPKIRLLLTRLIAFVGIVVLGCLIGAAWILAVWSWATSWALR